MFTGIVEERGRVQRIHGATVVVEAATVGADAAVGSSIAVSGVCLTVVANEPSAGGTRLLSFDVAPETRTRTTLGDVAEGRGVNLERPVTLTGVSGRSPCRTDPAGTWWRRDRSRWTA